MNKLGSLKISLSGLHLCMRFDPFYGVENKAIKSLISDVYDRNSENALYIQFRNKYSSKPCKDDQQREFILIWVGLLGLPTYRSGKISSCQWNDYVDNWTEESFEIKLDELKSFLRSHMWPLPTAFFSNEVDNTKRKIALDSEEYNHAFENFIVLLPKLEKELEELKNTPVISMSERAQKLNEIAKLEFQIKAILAGNNIASSENDNKEPPWINIARSYGKEIFLNEPSLNVLEIAKIIEDHFDKEGIRGRGNRKITDENIKRHALSGIKS